LLRTGICKREQLVFFDATNSVTFTLVVDDFEVKYMRDNNQEKPTKYLGLTNDVDKKAREVRMSAPGEIVKALKQFAPFSTAVARYPAVYVSPHFGSATQKPATPDISPLLTVDEHPRLQCLASALLFNSSYRFDGFLPSVTAIESALVHATQLTQRAADRLLAYFRHYPDNILTLKACNMCLHLQSDSSFDTPSHGRSVAGGIAYLGNEDPTHINGPILVHSSVIQNVMASIEQAEYAAAFYTAQMASGLRKTLSNLGYLQPPTYILVDNKVACFWDC
jgi:hypothetical protein